MIRLALALALAATALTLVPQAPATAAATTHVVHAGWTGPDGGEDKFVYTAYYPTHLQVHRGDVVEWQFPASYGGWHTVSFTHGDVLPHLWRADEHPGVIGMADAWAYGHEQGDDDVQCGRFSWLYAPDEQERCILTEDDIDDPGDQFSSNILDRFFSTVDAGSFVAEVDLPEGTYSYFCKIHPQMTGTLEVVPPGAAVDNPTEAELVRQRDADHQNATARAEELSKRAWNPLTREWTVHVGAETTDGRVEVLDYLPGKVTARRGDTVRFVGGTQEPNTVTFSPAPQGGFNLGGDCTATTCTGGLSSPHGLTGFAFIWLCDPDDTSSGAPGIPLAAVPSRVADDRAQGAIDAGCVEVDGEVPTRPEMVAGPTMASAQPAPRNLVAGTDTWHNSGILFAPGTPRAFLDKPDGTEFPTDFEATFPTAGTFPYFCIAHEFMRGQIDVI